MLKTKVTGKGHGTSLKRQEQRMRNEREKILCKMKRMGDKWNEFVYLADARRIKPRGEDFTSKASTG